LYKDQDCKKVQSDKLTCTVHFYLLEHVCHLSMIYSTTKCIHVYQYKSCPFMVTDTNYAEACPHAILVSCTLLIWYVHM